MSTIEQQIEALEFERAGYLAFGKDDRAAEVDEQLKYWRKQQEKHGAEASAEDLSPTERKRAIADGVITEAEAAQTPATETQDARNDLAAAHANQADIVNSTDIITDVEAAQEPQGKAEAESNALAAKHASDPTPAEIPANVVTEAEVVEETKAAAASEDGPLPRPARNATTEEWRAFEKSLPAPLGVADDAGRDEIVAAYIHTYAPGGNASKEAWVTYAKEHGIDPGDKSRDEIRAAAVEAGWANGDAPPAAAQAGPKRTTADSTPRTTR